jgi:hypothetical protein
MGPVKHRTESVAAPLRPVVRALAVALLMMGALLGGTFPVHAEPAAPVPHGAGSVPLLCPYHAASPGDSHGDPGGCGTETHACAQSTVPPIPPVLPAPVGSYVPPWLVEPDGSGSALAPASSAVVPTLHDICVSRT